MDGMSKPMGQNAAFEAATELPLDVDRHLTAIPVAFAAQAQIGLEVRLYHPNRVQSCPDASGSSRHSRLLCPPAALDRLLGSSHNLPVFASG